MWNPTVESEHEKELFKELKQAQQLAKLSISKAQFEQKVQYKNTSEVKATEGDL